jgi:chemotaxis protein MotB
MIKYSTLFSMLLLSVSSLQAQKKSDLLIEIQNLKASRDSINNMLVVSRKREVVSKTEADSYKAQTDELLETNGQLMQNITNFTKASIEKSENIGKTLESLQDKEAKLKLINDKFSGHDSIALAVLTDLKKILGENSTINVTNGAVVISLNEATRKGIAAKDAASDAMLTKIATVLNKYPDAMVTIEGVSNTGEFDLALNQATVLANKFQKKFSISNARLVAIAKDGGFAEGLNIRISPKFDAFYFLLREEIKENN